MHANPAIMVAQDFHHGRRCDTAPPGRKKLASTSLARGPRGKLFAGLLPTEGGGEVYRILHGRPLLRRMFNGTAYLDRAAPRFAPAKFLVLATTPRDYAPRECGAFFLC